MTWIFVLLLSHHDIIMMTYFVGVNRVNKMPKFTAHFTVFTTENAHFHFALTTFLTQNAYISALLAALYEISVYEMSIYEMSVYEVSDYPYYVPYSKSS